ncbi:MAG: TolC family protein [Planctomycetota bacterium]|nr:TolC family protein [Planctomycetota bacterium]
MQALFAGERYGPPQRALDGGRTARRPRTLIVLVAALVLPAGVCWAEESEFQDPAATETSATAGTNAKRETAASTDKAEKVEPAAEAPKPAQPDTVAKAEKPAAPETPASAEQPEKPVDTAAADKSMIEKAVSLDELVAPALPPEEKPLYDSVHEAFKAPGEVGGRSFLKGKTLTDIGVRGAAVQALERNLPLQIAAHEYEFRKAVVQEAWAAFLPVISVSGEYSNSNTWERKKFLALSTRLYKTQHPKKINNEKPIPGGENPFSPTPTVTATELFRKGEIVFVDPADKAHYYYPVVDGSGKLVDVLQYPSTTRPIKEAGLPPAGGVSVGGDLRTFLSKKKLGYVDPTGTSRVMGTEWNYVEASKEDRADERGTFSLNLFQQLPWGPQLSITVSPVYRDAAYDKWGNSFDRPWFSTFTMNAYIPLPGTRNFGPYSPIDTQIKLAQQGREQALWDFKASINVILQQVDADYLVLVNALKNLDAAVQNRKSVEALMQQTEQVLTAGRTTKFGRDQVDGEVQRVKRVEEGAWNGYITASDALVELLNFEAGTVLLPVGYSKYLNDRLTYVAGEAKKTALENRAELRSQEAQTRAAEILVKFQRHQERPDVSMVGGATFAQTLTPNGQGFRGNAGIGYEHLDGSLGSLFNQDVLSESYTGTFRRSLFNRGERGGTKIAEAQRDQQKFTARITENSVEQQVNDALAQLDSAKGVLEQAKAARDTARDVFKSTVDMQKEGRVTEFEVISKNQDYLNAEFALNSALVQYKFAETGLLFAEGVLPAQYPERTAPNEFERYRLGLLKATQALQFFGDGKETKAP